LTAGEIERAERILEPRGVTDPMEIMALAQAVRKVEDDWLLELAERLSVEPACKHRTRGLCLDCWDDYQEDPTAWAEYGYHAQGEANTKALFAELAADSPPLTEPPPACLDCNGSGKRLYFPFTQATECVNCKGTGFLMPAPKEMAGPNDIPF